MQNETLPRDSASSATPSGGLLLSAARRHPFLAFCLLVVLSNVVGSYFNITYNQRLIVGHYLDESQRAAFWKVLYLYNAVAYTAGVCAMVYLLRPLARCRQCLRRGQEIDPGALEACRRRLINLPLYQVILTFAAWLPGAVVFPLGICALGGWAGAARIWIQFGISFSFSALLTTMQTFFLLESFLIHTLYGEFFRDARPADVRGSVRISLGWRVVLLWGAIAVVPLLALLVVALSFTEDRVDLFEDLRALGVGVSLVGLPFSGFLMWLMGRSLLTWVGALSSATDDVAGGNFAVRVTEKRPDEFGRLTDRFNDMLEGLERGAALRETFGQFVNPEVRDEILTRYPDLGGEVEVVTVVFADIRGFTRRSAGARPEETVELLNRFLTLSVSAIEEQGGWVNKFLGDGFMGLFGAPRPRQDHADLAVGAALELLGRLETLNIELTGRGVAPLRVGVGIHTGPALVGCIGASLPGPRGGRRVRREFTAIGETVNVAQRIEGLTKTKGGPLLLSESTRSRLLRPVALGALGEVVIPGHEGRLVLHRALGVPGAWEPADPGTR